MLSLNVGGPIGARWNGDEKCVRNAASGVMPSIRAFSTQARWIEMDCIRTVRVRAGMQDQASDAGVVVYDVVSFVDVVVKAFML